MSRFVSPSWLFWVKREAGDGGQVSRSPPDGLQRSRLPPSADKNMKQVGVRNKDELDKESFPVCHGGPGAARAQRSSCKRKSCALEVVGVKLLRRQAPHADRARRHPPGMANKENELTCADDARGGFGNDNRGLPVSSAKASKMEGASAKYGDVAELSKDHEAMTQVLFGRNLRLKVAQTLWQKNASELVAYLIRIQDTGVLLDCLPVLTNNLQSEAPCLSLGCCVDLMPQVKLVLASKYAEHIMVGLHWLQSIIRKWWPELSKGEKRLQDSCSEDRNIEIMKQRLKELWKEGAGLCLVPGSVGDLAKAVEAHLSQLR